MIHPLNCSDHIQSCSSYLYHISRGLPLEQVASFYSANTSQIKPIIHHAKQDYLVSVPCTCKDVNGTRGYFYDTSYTVQPSDTFVHVSGEFYSGQAWKVAGEEKLFVPGDVIPMHLVCGCLELESEAVITYTVQNEDTLSLIGSLLSANQSRIQSLNERLTENPSFIDVGWVLFVPMEQGGVIQPTKQGKGFKKHNWEIIIGTPAAVITLFMSTLILFLVRRIGKRKNKEDSKASTESLSVKITSSKNQHLHQTDIEDVTVFESEGTVIYSLEEIDEATSSFDQNRKIGEGGYGSVYFGILGGREVAIKKMKSSRSKEFFAELKVEVLGYASGADHLYLVYEDVQNGSLHDHLHDPLLKGHQPLSWTARAHIALDTARGIEYIHDYTKACYVHRDVKTSNILLDQGLRAKVADFGLARLLERSNEEDFIVTRLVGTPGYIALESVWELQVTTKTDVFALGVVLAELITGQRTLTRDNREPNKTKTLIAVMNKMFGEKDPESALEAQIDGNLKGSYPAEEVYKMADIARKCLSEDSVNRPGMREIVHTLSQVLMSSIEWEAALGGNSQVFSGLLHGR